MLTEFRTTDLIWDKASRKFYENIEANESDENGRRLTVQVLNQSVIEDLSNATLSLYWKSLNGNKGLDAFAAIDASKGLFEIHYTTGMLSNSGKLKAHLVLVDTEGRIISNEFTITVSKGIDDSAIESSDSFTALTTALVTVNQYDEKIENFKTETTAQLAQIETDITFHKPIRISDKTPISTDGNIGDLWFVLSPLFEDLFTGADTQAWDSDKWLNDKLTDAGAGTKSSIEQNKGKLTAVSLNGTDNAVLHKVTKEKVIDFSTKDRILEFELNDYQQDLNNNTGFNIGICPTIPVSNVYAEPEWVRLNVQYSTSSFPASNRGIIVNAKTNGAVSALYTEERPNDNGLVKYQFVCSSNGNVALKRWNGTSWVSLFSIIPGVTFTQAYIVIEHYTKEAAGRSRFVDSFKVV